MNGAQRAPEPSEQDVARAERATASEVFASSDGALTVAYYRRLRAAGALGLVAMNLFRAQKTSSRAKQYRRRNFRNASYGVKNYSLEQLCAVLATVPAIKWGWGRDLDTVGFTHVLYVETPFGQVSFHSGTRLTGPAYLKDWDGQRKSEERILAFCDAILGERKHETGFSGESGQGTAQHDERQDPARTGAGAGVQLSIFG